MKLAAISNIALLILLLLNLLDYYDYRGVAIINYGEYKGEISWIAFSITFANVLYYLSQINKENKHEK
jgi:hypothetical protein